MWIKNGKSLFWGFSKIFKCIGLLTIAFFWGSNGIYGQDFYFSQYFNSPLATNPALTGKIKQDYRVAVINRSQWRSVSTPYMTTSGSFDMNFRKLIPFFNLVGVGAYFANDDLGDGIFRNQYVMGSFAGHKTLDNLKRHTLSFGLQAGVIFKSVNSNGFIFRNQYDNNLQVTQASGENLSGLNYHYFNLNAGLNWDFIISKVTKLTTGISMFNLTRPKDSPLLTTSHLNFRYSVQAALEYEVSYNFSLQPNVYYIYQSGAQVIYPGMIASYKVDKSGLFDNRTFYLGGYYRLKDCATAMVGIKEDKYQIWFSYDFTVSDLNGIQNTPDLVNNRSVMGAWELSLIYTGFLKRNIPNSRTLPCKFF